MDDSEIKLKQTKFYINFIKAQQKISPFLITTKFTLIEKDFVIKIKIRVSKEGENNIKNNWNKNIKNNWPYKISLYKMESTYIFILMNFSLMIKRHLY